MKPSWTNVRLGDLVDFYSGGTPSKAQARYWDGNVPWFSAKDLKHDRLTDSIDHISSAAFNETSLRRLPPRTIVIVVRGMILAHTVPISVLDVPAAINQDLKALIPKRPSEIDVAYLAGALRAQQARILTDVSRAAHGTTRLESRVLENIEVPLPPLDEQRRIAAVLDHVDELRAKRRRSLATTGALLRAATSRVVGSSASSTVNLGDVADFYAGGSLPQGVEFSGEPDGYLLLKVSDMNAPGNERELRTASLWSPTPGPRSATAPAGSVVIPKRGASIATNKKRLLLRPATLDPNLMAIAPLAELESRYLVQWFDAFDLQSITSGSSVPQLNKKDLVGVKIPLPPLDLQREFAATAAKIDAMRSSAEHHLAELDLLFASIQSRAFAGELDVSKVGLLA